MTRALTYSVLSDGTRLVSDYKRDDFLAVRLPDGRVFVMLSDQPIGARRLEFWQEIERDTERRNLEQKRLYRP